MQSLEVLDGVTRYGTVNTIEEPMSPVVPLLYGANKSAVDSTGALGAWMRLVGLIALVWLGACGPGDSGTETDPATPDTGTTAGTPVTSSGITTTGDTAPTDSGTPTTTGTLPTTTTPRSYGDWSNCEALIQIVDVNGTVLNQTWRTYGTRNTLVATSTDFFSPFTGPEQSWVHTYDANDVLIDTLWDWDASGSFDHHIAYTSHPSGNPATEYHDVDNDGLWDTENDFIEVGGRIETTETRVGGATLATSITTWIYDPISGQLSRQATDVGIDGTSEDAIDFVWPGPAGGDRQKSTDWGNDGVYESIDERSTNASGATTFEWEDYTADGITDKALSTTHHLDGRIDTVIGQIYSDTLVIPCLGLDGFIGMDTVYTYDAAGFPTNAHTVADPGNPVFITTLDDNYTWTCGQPIP